MIGDIMTDYELLKLDGSQYATEEELKIFWSTIYEADRLKPSGCLVINTAMQGGKIQRKN